MSVENIKICCLNVNGLRDKRKCQTVLTHISQKFRGIAMLQETHTNTCCEKTWSDLTDCNCFFAHGTTESRGVATLLSKELGAEILDVIRDDYGRFLVLDVKICDNLYVLVNTYAPTKDKCQEQVKFLDRLSLVLQKYIDRSIIWAGDLNTYLNPEIDKKGGIKETPSQYTTDLIGVLEHYDLQDIWRIRNPDSMKFTWRNKTRAGVVQSRIDYLFVSTGIEGMVIKTDIVPGIRSDHSLLYLSLRAQRVEQRGRGFWKFNTSLLKDEKYVETVRGCIEEAKTDNSSLTDKGLL